MFSLERNKIYQWLVFSSKLFPLLIVKQSLLYRYFHGILTKEWSSITLTLSTPERQQVFCVIYSPFAKIQKITNSVVHWFSVYPNYENSELIIINRLKIHTFENPNVTFGIGLSALAMSLRKTWLFLNIEDLLRPLLFYIGTFQHYPLKRARLMLFQFARLSWICPHSNDILFCFALQFQTPRSDRHLCFFIPRNSILCRTSIRLWHLWGTYHTIILR